jgi:hypothetical protein
MRPVADRRVRSTASEVRILEDGHLIAVHPVLEGRGRRIAAGHHPAAASKQQHATPQCRTRPRRRDRHAAIARIL